MLTDKIFELLMEYKDYEDWNKNNPNIENIVERINGISYSNGEKPNLLDHYHMSHLNICSFEKFGRRCCPLKKDEVKRLENLLIRVKKPKLYGDVLEFVEWLLKNYPFGGFDYKDHCWFSEEMRINLHTSKTSLSNEPSFPQIEKVRFFDSYYELLYFENLLPHWCQFIRETIKYYETNTNEMRYENVT